jgi:tetratricopeptide (TPR) repeat protein
VFYYLALLPSSRVLSLDGITPHLAERYLYFPSAGLAIPLAFAFRWLTRKSGARTVTGITLPLLVVLAALSWDRNADWSSEINLFETEYNAGHRGYQETRLLIARHHLEGHSRRITQICDENPGLVATRVRTTNTCVVAYTRFGRYDEAIAAFQAAAAHSDNWIEARINLARMYIGLGRLQEGADQFKAVVDGVDSPALKEIYTGDFLMTLYPKNRARLNQARAHYNRALKLDPDLASMQERLDAVDQLLEELTAEPADPAPSGESP